jgi:transposase-like protein
METQAEDDLLDGAWFATEELARMLGVDPSTLRRWRTPEPRHGPPFITLSSRVTLYSAHDVRCWLATRRIDPERVA